MNIYLHINIYTYISLYVYLYILCIYIVSFSLAADVIVWQLAECFPHVSYLRVQLTAPVGSSANFIVPPPLTCRNSHSSPPCPVGFHIGYKIEPLLWS